MNIRDLRYLVALSDFRHFGKAAEACFVSQPALSMQIKKLEKTLKTPLLERNNKTVLLTPVGHAIVEKAKQILDHIEAIQQLAQHTKDIYSGELKLGIIPTLAPYLLPLLMPILSKKFPKLRLYLIEEQTGLLIPKLKSGLIDCALLAPPVLEPNFSHTILFEEEFLLAVPPKHSLASYQFIKSEQLAQQQVLLLDEGHCMRGPTLELCQQVKAQEASNFRATSLETLRHMVATGHCVTLIPKLAKQSNDAVIYIPFQSPKPVRTIGLYWRSFSSQKNLITSLVQPIQESVSNYL